MTTQRTHTNPRTRTPVSTLLSVAAAMLVAFVSMVGLPATAEAAYPNLQYGSTGADVTSVQYLLTAHGHSTGADGIYGSGTQAAVEAFQSANGLEVDGVAGPNTIGALVVTLREGDTGPAVQALQVQLNKYGAGLDTDGSFGPLTTQAVRNFQSSKGLTVDGTAGPQTWSTLFGSGGSSDTPGENYDSLSDSQLANARTIIGVAKGHGISEYGQVIALATAMQESRLVNLDYGDRDSLGLFQQRPSMGWCDNGECTDPVAASRAFYGVATHTSNPGLLDISGWESMSVTDAAQAVQRSGYPDAYAQWEGLAREIVAKQGPASGPIE